MRETRRSSAWDDAATMPFRFRHDPTIPDIVHVEAIVFEDDRGWFAEVYRASDFASHGIVGPFVQTDHSFSRQDALRGLHYQLAAAAQGKLVLCLSGRVYDVAVDIRRSSPTFGRHVGVTLDARERRSIWIPPGFAHGFLTLSVGAELLYQHTTEYDPQLRRAIRWNDPALAIPWPLEGRTPSIGADDANAPLLADAEVYDISQR